MYQRRVVRWCVRRVHKKKGRAVSLVSVAKEHYLRDDIPCGVPTCRDRVCESAYAQRVLGAGAGTAALPSHYVVFDAVVGTKYLDLVAALNSAGLTADAATLQPHTTTKEPVSKQRKNAGAATQQQALPTSSPHATLILLQTVANEAQRVLTHSSFNRLMEMATTSENVTNRVHYFSNEHFSKTYVEAGAADGGQTGSMAQSIVKACAWYQAHVKKCGLPVFLVAEDQDVLALAKTALAPNSVFTCGEYLHTYHPSSFDLIAMHDSIQLQLEQKEHQLLQQQQQGADAEKGPVFRGHFRVCGKNNSEAEVRIESQEDILIVGKENMGHAIHGDTVLVRLLPKELWTAHSQEIRSADEAENEMRATVKGSQPCGVVVGIEKRNWRPYVCTLPEDESYTAEGSMAALLAVPYDSRIPKIRMRTRHARQLASLRVVVCIDAWPADSRYPEGHFVRSLGEVHTLAAEMASVLVEHGISCPTFTSAALATLPIHVLGVCEWRIPAAEYSRRRDVRSANVMSIDPRGCVDVDDALSVKTLPGNCFEVGVHIADVAYFIREGSLLDREAKQRSTTVYLPHTRFNMLPSVLSEDLCSLHGGRDRLAVSVIWKFSPEFEVLDIWFGRTVVNNKHELCYEFAQSAIDGALSAEEQKRTRNLPALERDLKLMLELSRKLRKERLAKGALELESDEVQFEFQPDSTTVAAVKPHGDLEVNHMVAEFMLLANEAVARQITDVFPTGALLRNHPSPHPMRFQALLQSAAAAGFTMDISSNKSLAESLQRARHPTKPEVNQLLRNLATRAMSEAMYISTGNTPVSEFYHYGLAVDRYTHFTSPIRRYADVVVHRLLLKSVGQYHADTGGDADATPLHELAEHMNERHSASRCAQKDATRVFQYLFFKDAPQIADALIYCVKRNGVLVHVHSLSVKGVIYWQDREGRFVVPTNVTLGGDAVTDFTADVERCQVTLRSANGKASTLKLFDTVKVKVEASASRSHRPELSLSLCGCDLLSNERTRPNAKPECATRTRDIVNALEKKEKVMGMAASLEKVATKQVGKHAHLHFIIGQVVRSWQDKQALGYCQTFRFPQNGQSTSSLYGLLQSLRITKGQPTRKTAPGTHADQTVRRWALTPEQQRALEESIQHAISPYHGTLILKWVHLV
eukprot:TRINITY_DN1830_c0_g1_i6.p1 TRINITY_DN1830_c0_g1~~TRINITY_DN1830_c0_g1_i6.p1  ORF type:complete len:1151 (+),score=241.45 TRINITY_DN1830_c0_g1_i6:1094-4546(+)